MEQNRTALQYRWVRRFLSILTKILAFLLISGGIVALSGTVKSASQKPEENTVPFIFLGLVLSVAGAWLYKFSKKLAASPWEIISRNDTRPPVLYLRSFTADKKGEKQHLHGWWRKLAYLFTALPTNMTTQEEQLSLAFDDIGPMLAVAKPNSWLSPSGAARVGFENDKWQEEVRKKMRDASIVVIRADGNSRGLLWEIENVFREKNSKHIIFLLPASQDQYNSFCELFPPDVSSRLSAYSIKDTVSDFSGILYFTEYYMPTFVALKDSIFSPSGDFFNHIAIAIKQALKNIDLQIPERRTLEIVSIPDRMKAFLYDLLIVIPLSLIAGVMYFCIAEVPNMNDFAGTCLLAFLLILVLYRWCSEIYSVKGTFGKRKMNIFIADKSQLKPTAQQIFFRNFNRTIFFLPLGFFIILYTIIAWYKNLPLFHDYFSRTRIFRLSKQ